MSLSSGKPVLSESPPAVQPTRVRLSVLWLLCAMTFVLYLDRVCIGQAAVPIKRELGLSDTQMGWVFAAFSIAYGLFGVPAGRLGDRYGTRWIMTWIVVWWSAFTLLTAACFGLFSLLAVRFLFGAGEAGAMPNAARVLDRWFPTREQGRARGWVLTASLAGAAVVPVLASYLIVKFGWRWVFPAFGAVGMAWAALFATWYRDDPDRHSAVNDAERKLINAGRTSAGETVEPTPWRAALRNRCLWLLGGITCCSAFTSYFFYSWYPMYLQAGRGVPTVEAGWLASFVMAGSAAGTLLGGYGDDWIVRQENPLVWRKRVGSFACALAAVLLVSSIAVDIPWVAALIAAMAGLALTSQLTTWWACATEISGRHVGALFGFMNMLGLGGAIASQLFFGVFADWAAAQGRTGRAQWDPAFFVPAGLLLVAACGWWWVNPARPIGATSALNDKRSSPEGSPCNV